MTEKMTVGESRKTLGLTQKEVFESVGVPIRTQQNWEAGVRECPDYIRRLIVEELFRIYG